MRKKGKEEENRMRKTKLFHCILECDVKMAANLMLVTVAAIFFSC